MGPILFKTLSVQWIVEDTLKLFKKNKKIIPRNFGDHHLFTNIHEAVFYDITQGNWNNAEAGKILANVIGKKHALKKYDQFALNTSCFWGSTRSNITPVV